MFGGLPSYSAQPLAKGGHARIVEVRMVHGRVGRPGIRIDTMHCQSVGDIDGAQGEARPAGAEEFQLLVGGKSW